MNFEGTIGLDFCADSNVKGEVRTDLHTASVHVTLITKIHREIQMTDTGKIRYQHIDMEVFTNLLGRSSYSCSIRSQEKLEPEVCELIELIKTALTGACLRRTFQNSST